MSSALVGGWGTGILGCLENPLACLLGWCCPCVMNGCIYFGAIEQNKKKAWLVCCISWLSGGLALRLWLADKHAMNHDPVVDCCVGCICPGCGLCQEYRWMADKFYADLAGAKSSPIEVYKKTLGSD